MAERSKDELIAEAAWVGRLTAVRSIRGFLLMIRCTDDPIFNRTKADCT